MLRGAVIIFTGLLSVGMLNAQIKPFKWFGMLFVMLGLVIVGVTDIYYDDDPLDDKNAIITGNLLIVMAQIIVAIQMVYEQKYLTKYDVPALFAVGLEGLFGMVTLSILMIPFYYIHVPRTFSTNPEGRLEDVFYAWKEITEEPTIALALSGTVVSIAFFNFAGVSVTKELSATTRMVLDSVRTLVIWVVSIPLFHEKFIAIQVIFHFIFSLKIAIFSSLDSPCSFLELLFTTTYSSAHGSAGTFFQISAPTLTVLVAGYASVVVTQNSLNTNKRIKNTLWRHKAFSSVCLSFLHLSLLVYV